MKQFIKIGLLTLTISLSGCVLFSAAKNTAVALIEMPFKLAGAAIAVIGAATGVGILSTQDDLYNQHSE